MYEVVWSPYVGETPLVMNKEGTDDDTVVVASDS